MLKNPSSIRQVPIHPACEPYVERLFFSKAMRPGASWSYKFGKNLGLPAGDAAHSLRHSLTTRMTKVGIIGRVQSAILGHSSKSITEDYGEVELETKYQAIIASRLSNPVATGKVWILKDGKPSPVNVNIGVGDGNVTELVRGNLKEGQLVLTGIKRGNDG